MLAMSGHANSSLQSFRDSESELTAIFEMALSEARRSLDCPVQELDWYSNCAKEIGEEFPEGEKSVALEVQ